MASALDPGPGGVGTASTPRVISFDVVGGSRRARRLHGVVRRPVVQRSLSVVVVLIVWQLYGVHNTFVTSYPSAIYRAAVDDFGPEVLPAFRETLKSFGLGFGISVVAGIPIGLAMARIRLARVVLEPYVNTLYSLPMVALFPLLIVAFGIGFPLRVGATVLFGIFAVVVNTYIGASSVDPAFEDTSRVFVASPWKRLTTVILPASLRYIFAGVRIGFGHGMIGAVVIELEASALGVGSLLGDDARAIRLDKFFVVVFTLGFFSIACGVVMRLMERALVEPWTRPRALRPRGTVAVLPAGAALRSRRLTDPRLEPARRQLTAWGRTLGRAVHAILRRTWGAWTVRILVLVGLLAYWQVSSRHISKAVLPSPVAVAKSLYHQTWVDQSLFGPLKDSLELLVVGFVLATAIGVVVGLAMGQFRWVSNVLDPYIAFLYALPHAVFIPLMVVWLGFDFKFGLAYVVLSAVFPVIINSMQSVRSLKSEYTDTARSFCASPWDTTRTVVLPHAIPYVVTGARLAFSVSWIAVVVSEVLTSQNGLGGLITVYGNSYRSADMVVPVVIITVISVSILQFTTWFAPRLTPWAPSSLGK
jgi:NitT/TauT family transport system permease protein